MTKYICDECNHTCTIERDLTPTRCVDGWRTEHEGWRDSSRRAPGSDMSYWRKVEAKGDDDPYRCAEGKVRVVWDGEGVGSYHMDLKCPGCQARDARLAELARDNDRLETAHIRLKKIIDDEKIHITVECPGVCP